jgi:hypothetical protein
LLAVFGVLGVVYAILEMLKAKKMQSVPFHKPSDIAQKGAASADAKGWVSTEGSANAAQPLIAPMSGQPCLAYEITVMRKWEKSVQTEKGTETKRGSDKVHEEYKGTVFQVSDGTGAVNVDAGKKPDIAMEKSHSATVKVGLVIPGTLEFGHLQLNTPRLPKDSRTIAFEATETILKPCPTLYAMGTLKPGAPPTIGNPDGIVGRLVLSHKGREKLLASTKRNMIVAYAIGGVLALGGTGLGIFGPKSKGGCDDFVNATKCDGRIYLSSGIDYQWTVQKAGTYKLVIHQPKVKNPIDGAITVTDAKGTKVAYDDGGSAGADATITQAFAPGVYTVNVKDFAGSTIKGGYGFRLEVAQLDAGSAAPNTEQAGLQPAVVPSGSATCEKAVVCCKAFTSGKSDAACDSLRNAADATCKSSINSFKKAAKHNKAAKAACSG